MADLITRPDSRSAIEPESLADRLLDTQSPQRPQSSPRIRIEVDGRVVEGFEGQTILEVCRDNGIEIPTLCYEPKLPGFGACRMCVVEVEGEEHPPISCSRTCEPEMKVQTVNAVTPAEKGRGTKPDVLMERHVADVLRGVDVPLERTIELARAAVEARP